MSNTPTLHGLHHVTAVTADARANYHFYTRLLGMRLVKKTVNQDDVSAYHLFYADEAGSPGTDLTFFEWPQSTPARQGAGAVTETALRIAGGSEALTRWGAWFDGNKVPHGGIEPATATAPDTLAFLDRMSRSIAEALDLPTLEAVTAEYLGDVSTPMSRRMLAEKARQARERHALRQALWSYVFGPCFPPSMVPSSATSSNS